MQHDTAPLGPSGLGLKWAISTAVATPIFSVETFAFVAKVAVAALVAGLVNIALEAVRASLRRRADRRAGRPVVATPGPAAPLLTDIPGDIPGAPSALDDDLSD